jgi:hypothetical protein
MPSSGEYFKLLLLLLLMPFYGVAGFVELPFMS